MNSLPLFDSHIFLKQQHNLPSRSNYPSFAQKDFQQAREFLLSYQHNIATFQAYRREVERLLQWAWWVSGKSIQTLSRADMEAYITFCMHPPISWIGLRKVPRFLEKDGQRIPNPAWKPFVVTLSKSTHRKGQPLNPKYYALSEKSLQEVFTIISSFYQYLILENYTEINPLQQIRQKSRYFRRHQGKARIVRRLSELQWHYVIETAEKMASDSIQHERTLFILSILYSLYLRISELVSSERWTPTMGDFHCDTDGLWWFITVGKGNKLRHISVSDTLLEALRRYRRALGLSPALPLARDPHPLIPKQLGKGPITSSSRIRILVQNCFDQAIDKLKQDGFIDEAESLLEATVHWLRHTGISEDVKHRRLEHVRDDAGHSSSAITDKYIDIERRERHASGKQKLIKPP